MISLATNITNNPLIISIFIPFLATVSTEPYVFFIVYHCIFLDFSGFFCFHEQGTISSLSSSERVVILSPEVTFRPHLFLIRFFSTPTPQFSFKTWSTDSLNISLSTLSYNVMTDGKRLRLAVYLVDIFHLQENLKQGYILLICSLICTIRREKLFSASYHAS